MRLEVAAVRPSDSDRERRPATEGVSRRGRAASARRQPRPPMGSLRCRPRDRAEPRRLLRALPGPA
eukprot:15472132-Alexandrium_andersonii.AAC.1